MRHESEACPKCGDDMRILGQARLICPTCGASIERDQINLQRYVEIQKRNNWILFLSLVIIWIVGAIAINRFAHDPEIVKWSIIGALLPWPIAWLGMAVNHLVPGYCQRVFNVLRRSPWKIAAAFMTGCVALTLVYPPWILFSGGEIVADSVFSFIGAPPTVANVYNPVMARVVSMPVQHVALDTGILAPLWLGALMTTIVFSYFIYKEKE